MKSNEERRCSKKGDFSSNISCIKMSEEGKSFFVGFDDGMI
jgi:hypothetical protein